MAVTVDSLLATLAGAGLAFPFDLTGSTALSSGFERVRQELVTLLRVEPFEVVHRPEGSVLYLQVFEPVTDAFLNLLRTDVLTVLSLSDKVVVESVEVVKDEQDEHRVQVSVRYSLRQTRISDVLTHVMVVERAGGGTS